MSTAEPARNTSPADDFDPDSASLLGADDAGGSRSRRRWVRAAVVCGVVALAVPAVVIGYVQQKYATSGEMVVAIEERDPFAYPEDPSPRSTRQGQYQGRQLRLVQRDETHFDFVFEPADAAATPQIATVTFHNVDVSRMTPGVPEWTLGDEGLVRIALTDREWNRQQVQFPGPAATTASEDLDAIGRVSIVGGDGWEAANCTVASLAKNCLNGGLWEVLLFHHDDDGRKQMFYQGWYTFPMGHYARLVERNTGLTYRDHWYKLEHWDDPAGTVVNLDGLRTVQSETTLDAAFDPAEPLIVGGEQVRKRRTLSADNVNVWGDLPKRSDTIRFATFIPPGTYDVATPWENEYWRLTRFEGVTHRRVTAADGQTLDELEVAFVGTDGSTNRFLVGGVDLAALPQLPQKSYPKGLYMPMGIGVPPFYQDYADLLAADPMRSPYYSVLLDDADRWIDHHSAAIDGPVMLRDETDPSKLHLFLLSYERHTLVAHLVIDLPKSLFAESGDNADGADDAA